MNFATLKANLIPIGFVAVLAFVGIYLIADKFDTLFNENERQRTLVKAGEDKVKSKVATDVAKENAKEAVLADKSAEVTDKIVTEKIKDDRNTTKVVNDAILELYEPIITPPKKRLSNFVQNSGKPKEVIKPVVEERETIVLDKETYEEKSRRSYEALIKLHCKLFPEVVK